MRTFPKGFFVRVISLLGTHIQSSTHSFEFELVYGDKFRSDVSKRIYTYMTYAGHDV